MLVSVQVESTASQAVGVPAHDEIAVIGERGIVESGPLILSHKLLGTPGAAGAAANGVDLSRKVVSRSRERSTGPQNRGITLAVDDKCDPGNGVVYAGDN